MLQRLRIVKKTWLGKKSNKQKPPKPHQDLESYYANPWPYVDQGSMLLFAGFPSAKDPMAAKNHPEKSTCVTSVLDMSRILYKWGIWTMGAFWRVQVGSVNVDAFAATARLVSSICFHHQPAFHVYWALWFPVRRPLHQVIITEAKEEWFSDWKDAKQGRRGKDYEQMKQRFQDSNSSGGNWHKRLWLSLMLMPGINGECLRKSLYPTSRLRRWCSSWLVNPQSNHWRLGNWQLQFTQKWWVPVCLDTNELMPVTLKKHIMAPHDIKNL